MYLTISWSIQLLFLFNLFLEVVEMVIHNKLKRRVECEKCGEILLLQASENDFYRPQECEHYKVLECYEPDCEDCLLRDVAECFPTSDVFVWCIIPKR